MNSFRAGCGAKHPARMFIMRFGMEIKEKERLTFYESPRMRTLGVVPRRVILTSGEGGTEDLEEGDELGD